MTESASELAFDTRFSNLNFNKACRALRQERNRTKSFWQGWGGLFVIALGIGAVAGAVSGLIGGNLGGTLAYVIIFGGMIAFLVYRSRQAQSVVREAPIRSGVTRVRLDPEGYTTIHPGLESRVRWSHVHGVVTTPEALLILHSGYEFFPIEAGAFADT